MSQGFSLVLPFTVFLLVLLLCFWERREAGDLGPLWLGLAAGGVAGAAALGAGRLASLTPLFSRWPCAGGALSSLLSLVVLWLLARWPRVETPLDAAWMGMAVGSGVGLVAGLGGLRGLSEPWLPIAGLTAGAVLGSLLGLRWLWPGWGGRLFSGALSLGLALPWAWGWMAVFAQVGLLWVLWLLATSVVLLALAFALWVEQKVLQPQLAEEVGFGLLPSWVAEAGARFWRRFSRRWASRRDERKAMVRLVVRLAACKAYLQGKGKHRSTAAVELGRLRERARRLFDETGSGLES